MVTHRFLSSKYRQPSGLLSCSRSPKGKSLRQISRNSQTSYEAVRRVLSAALKELVVGEGELAALNPKDTEE